MEKKDLIKDSPFSLLNNLTEGGLKTGQMGLVTAKKGLGKTSVLVQAALDALIKDLGVVHVSFDQHSSNVISWYESILQEITKKKRVPDSASLVDSIVSKRTILNFNQETFSFPKVVSTIKALIAGGIQVSLIVVDGANMDKVSESDLQVFSDYVKEAGLTAWFSATCEADKLTATLTKNKVGLFSIVGHLSSNGQQVSLKLLKTPCEEANGAGEVKSVALDSKSLLMVK